MVHIVSSLKENTEVSCAKKATWEPASVRANAGNGCLFAIGVVLFGLGLVCVLGWFWIDAAYRNDDALVELVATAVPLGLGGIFCFYNASRNRIAEHVVGPVYIRWSSNILKTGERRYFGVRVKPAQAVEIERIELVLTGHKKSVSKNRPEEVRRVSVLGSVENTSISPQELVEVGTWVSLSTDDATFEADTQKGQERANTTELASLRWRLELRIIVRGWPNWVGEFPITVHECASV